MALMRKFRPDPNAIYVTTQSVAIDVDGVPYVFKHGERLRGSHPAVARLGLGAVVPDGTPESEWPSEIDAAIATLDAELAAEQGHAAAGSSADRPLDTDLRSHDLRDGDHRQQRGWM